MISILRARIGLELNQALSGASCFSDWRIWSLILWKRSMGATDMFYRLFWCFSGATSTSTSQSTGSQHHSLVVATPSGPTSCWLGFLSGSSNQRGTTTRIGNDTAEIPSNLGTSPRLSSQNSLIQSQKRFGDFWRKIEIRERCCVIAHYSFPPFWLNFSDLRSSLSVP